MLLCCYYVVGCTYLIYTLIYLRYMPPMTTTTTTTSSTTTMPTTTHFKSFYLFIGQNRGQYFVHRLGVIWYLLLSCTISHHTEFAHMYVGRQYHGYVHLPTRRELREPNHPNRGRRRCCCCRHWHGCRCCCSPLLSSLPLPFLLSPLPIPSSSPTSLVFVAIALIVYIAVSSSATLVALPPLPFS
jgi:hypothetical protein